jgi:hypothetical protein
VPPRGAVGWREAGYASSTFTRWEIAMSTSVWRGSAICAVVLSSIVPASFGQDAPARESDAVARLEAYLAAQEERIARLKEQVAAESSQDMDQARIEAMRQQIREVLADEEFREELAAPMLQAGYDDGFFIRSTDDKFRVNFNGFLQFRYTYYGTRSTNRDASPGARRHDRSGFDIQRARFIISGNAYSEDLTYYVHLYSDAPYDYDTGLLWGYVNYRFADEIQLTAGLIPLPSTRAYFLDEQGYQFVDLPIVDTVFALGDGVGVMLWGQVFGKKLNYYVAVSNEVNGPAGSVITPDEERVLDNNPAITFRTVWHVLGEDSTEGLYEGDLEHLEQPVLDLGFHYGFTEDDGDATTSIPYPRRNSFLPGGFGEASSEGLQIHQFGVDTHFKWRGLSLTGFYGLRLLDVKWGDHAPFAPLFLATGDDSTNAQHGGYAQAGYFLPIPGLENKLEAVARVGGISALSGGQEGTWEYAAGLNYYIEGHNVKVQMDVTKVSEAPTTDSYTSLANVNDDVLVWRVQLQVAF